MNAQREQIYRSDLETAATVGFFEMRVRSLKEMGAELPENIESLRQQVAQRNIQKLEGDIASARTDDYKAMLQRQMDDIKREYISS